MKKRLFKAFLCVFTLSIILVIWIDADLDRKYKIDIHSFDADEVARLDTAMWISYYSRERLKLFGQLGDLLKSEFHFPFWRRQMVAYYAAKAAFVFKDGKTREDYERALPDLKKFYSNIRDISTTDFDVDRAAQLELEWWIVHRQREQHAPGDLARALADSAACVYGVPAETLVEYGTLRAEAMDIRDNKADTGGVTEEDWKRIDDLLRRSWTSLHTAVNRK